MLNVFYRSQKIGVLHLCAFLSKINRMVPHNVQPEALVILNIMWAGQKKIKDGWITTMSQ
jgi:hypothetical protein